MLKEPADNRPGELGSNGVGENVARHASLTDGELKRAKTLPLKFNDTLETLHWPREEDIGDRLCDRNPDRVCGPDGQRPEGRRVL
jgi:hypothetical protein